MLSPIDFYFDFISPYAYLASRRIEDLALRHQRRVNWHPFRLGVAVVKVMGLRPILETPLKGDYMIKDIHRLANALGAPLTESLDLPNPIPPARLFYACCASEHAGALAKALLHARWAQGLDIGDEQVLCDVARTVGFAPEVVARALRDPLTREALTDATQLALDRGVFGSPTVVVGGELFWGTDRLWLVDQFLGNQGRYAPLKDDRLAALGFR